MIADWRQKAPPGVSIAKARELAEAAAVKVPTSRKGWLSGVSEPQNLSTTTDVARIQAALRSAERGDTWQLFTLYRDMVLNYSHLQAEWGKRKMVIIGQPQALIPADKNSKDDQIACEVIQQMIASCDNWFDGLTHLLDATLYPVSVVEKIFEPVAQSETKFKHPIRFKLKELCPVSYTLLCFKAPYIGQTDSEGALRYDPNEYEPDLRFYKTEPISGRVDWSMSEVYRPDPMRHVIHRGDIFGRSFRDNFGGQMRAILFWWLVSTADRDWFSQYMQKYGSPFVVGKVDAQQKDTVEFMQNALALATQIGGLVVDKRAEVELEQAAAADGATAHKTFIDVCNREVSKIVLGQELSSTAKNTGLGSGMADFHGEVREDFRQFDTTKLSDTLSKQLFKQFLDINGYRGNPPKIAWGGKRDAEAAMLAKTLQGFGAAGIEPTDDGLITLSERVGYGLQRKPEPVAEGGFGKKVKDTE